MTKLSTFTGTESLGVFFSAVDIMVLTAFKSVDAVFSLTEMLMKPSSNKQIQGQERSFHLTTQAIELFL